VIAVPDGRSRGTSEEAGVAVGQARRGHRESGELGGAQRGQPRGEVQDAVLLGGLEHPVGERAELATYASRPKRPDPAGVRVGDRELVGDRRPVDPSTRRPVDPSTRRPVDPSSSVIVTRPPTSGSGRW
jgi:hypothetical protein